MILYDNIKLNPISFQLLYLNGLLQWLLVNSKLVIMFACRSKKVKPSSNHKTNHPCVPLGGFGEIITLRTFIERQVSRWACHVSRCSFSRYSSVCCPRAFSYWSLFTKRIIIVASSCLLDSFPCSSPVNVPTLFSTSYFNSWNFFFQSIWNHVYDIFKIKW